VPRVITAVVSPDLSLKHALQRRSPASTIVASSSLQFFGRWTYILGDAYMGDSPTVLAKVSIEQLHGADMQLFKVMTRETCAGIRWSPGGGYAV
jgi:hypothetical protein